MANSLEYMYPDSFDWQTWRAGSLHDLGIIYKESELIKSKNLIKKYAVGYCSGESLMCRPKEKTVAVMFIYQGNKFWTHLMRGEFSRIFGIV